MVRSYGDSSRHRLGNYQGGTSSAYPALAELNPNGGLIERITANDRVILRVEYDGPRCHQSISYVAPGAPCWHCRV